KVREREFLDLPVPVQAPRLARMQVRICRGDQRLDLHPPWFAGRMLPVRRVLAVDVDSEDQPAEFLVPPELKVTADEPAARADRIGIAASLEDRDQEPERFNRVAGNTRAALRGIDVLPLGRDELDDRVFLGTIKMVGNVVGVIEGALFYVLAAKQ